MNLNFIPYKLNADISDFNGNMEYISSDNGIDYYRTKESFMSQLLGFSVSVVNLYFFEGTLISVYIQIGEMPDKLHKLKVELEKALEKDAKYLKTITEVIHYWQGQDHFIGLLIQKEKNILLIYHTLNKFNVFIQ
jgi:hypothetical protein